MTLDSPEGLFRLYHSALRMEAILKRLERGVLTPKFLALRVTIRSCTCFRRQILCPLGAVFLSLCCCASAFTESPVARFFAVALMNIFLFCNWRRKVYNIATT